MNLPGPCAVFGVGCQQARGFGHQPQEGVHAHREVRTPHDAGAVPGCGGLHRLDLFQPPGGADHHVDTQRRDAFHVARHRRGNREIDGHIDAAEVFGSDAFAGGVVELV